MTRKSARLIEKKQTNYHGNSCPQAESTGMKFMAIDSKNKLVRNYKRSKKRNMEVNTGNVELDYEKLSKKSLPKKVKLSLPENVTEKERKSEHHDDSTLKFIRPAIGSKLLIGCHTSISGGLWKAPEEAKLSGAQCFGLFLHNQQQWKMKPLLEGHAKRFKDTCAKCGYALNHIVPHGSYLMNCGSAKKETREKSSEMLVEELKRCEKLGLKYFNFHPGSTLGKISVKECLTYIADAINNAHDKTKFVVTLLENMSCQGNTVGGKFEELRGIIDLVKDKTRVGVCIDTCHAHAAGYDLSTVTGYDVLVNDLESIIGLKYVKAFHMNDSKGPSGCKKDRHENIGKGTIGLNGFKCLVNDKRFAGIPMILETPLQISDEKEIKLLYSLAV